MNALGLAPTLPLGRDGGRGWYDNVGFLNA